MAEEAKKKKKKKKADQELQISPILDGAIQPLKSQVHTLKVLFNIRITLENQMAAMV